MNKNIKNSTSSKGVGRGKAENEGNLCNSHILGSIYIKLLVLIEEMNEMYLPEAALVSKI